VAALHRVGRSEGLNLERRDVASVVDTTIALCDAGVLTDGEEDGDYECCLSRTYFDLTFLTWPEMLVMKYPFASALGCSKLSSVMKDRAVCVLPRNVP